MRGNKRGVLDRGPDVAEEGDRRQVIWAATARGRDGLDEWLDERLSMGHGLQVDTLVQRMRRDKKVETTLKRYGQIQRVWD